ncbi:LacI family DNA-binding transcriptional regulator [Alloacidobacterium dinghuense]|uniref:LacI family DNA-binding transcriptional regulator n=1 Tax=Alloacidobacterium dinghuense TaxID=2763107 RepID=A0A7G8BI85_9BACT|nr:LacI family DNA-binding transcriptional regulator [Alloacidobacterium dinghuense]QNI32255.1 LacI family DNA-binding transcriptional regulator [Alloacidobacterium dinghuense]
MAGRRHTSNRVTIVDVARKSGFSPSTVSIVLNEAPLSRYVAAKTKEHIRKIAQAMGYRPDAFARSLRSRRSHTIGVMIFDISDPFCTLILRGIEKTLHPTRYLPIIMDAHNERKLFEGYLEMLLDRRVEGLIVVANWLFAETDLLADMEKHSIPTVVIGRDLTSSHISSVLVDNAVGAYAALDHLYELGHRKIAFIRGPASLHDSVNRWRGIEKFAAERELELDPKLIRELPEILEANSGFDGGVDLTADLIRSHQKFTALMAFDDVTALGSLRALMQAGVRVPEDCSVIGFDGVPPAAFCTPAITTICQPMEEMGMMGTEWVLKSIDKDEDRNASAPVLKLLPPAVLVRGSTRSCITS